MLKYFFAGYVVFSAPLLFIALWINTDLDTAMEEIARVCSIALGVEPSTVKPGE